MLENLKQVPSKFAKHGGKVVAAATGVIALGGSNAMALAATDFDTTSAISDIGLAAVAVIGIAVVIMGFRGVRSMLH